MQRDVLLLTEMIDAAEQAHRRGRRDRLPAPGRSPHRPVRSPTRGRRLGTAYCTAVGSEPVKLAVSAWESVRSGLLCVTCSVGTRE